MARYRLSTDILSPINSDISLNDISAFSFGSLSGTPDYDKDIESPMCKNIEKDSDINLLCTRTMKESVNAFEVITNDIKKQSNINAEKEETYKESYETLKQSMDDLFYPKASNSSFESPVLENFHQTLKDDSKINTIKIFENPQYPKVCKKTTFPNLKNNSQTSSKKPEKNKKESSTVINREKKTFQRKSTRTLKGSAENMKMKNKVHIGNETGSKKNVALFGHKTKSDKISSSTQTSESFEAKATISKNSSEKNEEKGDGSIKKFHFKSQKKIPVSSNMPTTEQKNLSIEKSIQIAIGMEMDNIRSFMLDQNLSIRKDLLKLQETAKKHTEVTGYLFSVIDELLETNKKLISKHKKCHF